MSAEIKVEDGILYIQGDILDEESGKGILDHFNKNPEKKFNAILDVEKVDLTSKTRKKILNDIIKAGKTPRIAAVDPPLKAKVFMKVIRASGHKKLQYFDDINEAVEFLKGD